MFRRSMISTTLLGAFALAACNPASSTSSDAKSGAGPGGAGSSADARFFLPTGDPDNTSAPRLAIDAAGNTHAIYPAYARGSAYYAFCGADCAGPEQVKVVKLDTEGTVHNAMIVLDRDGHPRVLLSTATKVYFATCDADCTKPESWTKTELFDHGGDREVTGEALALDNEGHPRFLMHTYRAYLGIGQKTPQTFFVQCDADCHTPASWKQDKISNQIWESSYLRFDAQGRAHVATVASGDGADKLAAYARCDGNCASEGTWVGAGLAPAYKNDTEAVSIAPSVAMELTKAGNPRVLVLAKTDAGKKNLTYFACDGECTKEGWSAAIVSEHDKINQGIDLALDANDHPRYVYTLDYNIILGRCDADNCTVQDAPWKLSKVEMASSLVPDKIFLEWNCTISAWFLHGPSLALTPDGLPRVGYQARDISGGFSQPDKLKPRCRAGTDMTWSRLALMSKYE
jgi:hypothetical protein